MGPVTSGPPWKPFTHSGNTMNRRDALKVMAAGLAPGSLFADDKVREYLPLYGGWINNPAARRQFINDNRNPFISQLSSSIKGTGEGRVVMLHPFLERAMGHAIIPHKQGIGDCVGHAFAVGVDILTGVQIFLHDQPEEWIAEAAVEVIYSGSRVEIGRGKVRGDGSNGHWAASFLSKYGVLLRQEYPGGHDFTTYSPSKCREMGKTGVPDELEALTRLHPVKTIALVKTWREFCDAIANGYPVTLCSNVGFGMNSSYWVRDSEGFLKRRGYWGHAMLGMGVDDKSNRPGACILNSWGDWVRGPTRHGQPIGSFWGDRAVIESILDQGDCHALSGYVGYPAQNIPDYIMF